MSCSPISQIKLSVSQRGGCGLLVDVAKAMNQSILDMVEPKSGRRAGPSCPARVHFIGIGGCGMNAAASMLLAGGASVSGSDRQTFPGLSKLTVAGAVVKVGQHIDRIAPDLDLVVVSIAIPQDHTELQCARRNGTPVLTYPQLVGLLMKSRSGIALAGTHGKTTTTALTAHMLRHGGMDPSYIFGGTSPQLDGASHLGQGPHFVVEACEFDRSFLSLAPRSAAVLNVDADHLDCFRNLDEIIDAFCEFAARVPANGLLVLNHADAARHRLAAASSAMVETFGLDADATWRAVDLRADRGCWAFEVHYRGQYALDTRLNLPGMHNVENALAATALAHHAGADPQAIAEAMATFTGVDRRMTWRGRPGGVNVIDDYAHHPRAIRCTLQAIKEFYQPRRVWVVFQPHQHSRTRLLLEDFATCFELAQEVIVPAVFEARDSVEERQRTCGRDLVAAVENAGGRARYMPSFDDIATYLQEQAHQGDVIVTMGAGDIWKVADELVRHVRGAA